MILPNDHHHLTEPNGTPHLPYWVGPGSETESGHVSVYMSVYWDYCSGGFSLGVNLNNLKRVTGPSLS